MDASAKTLLGGRYKLSGEFARSASVARGWDRWLDRAVFIKIFANAKIDGCAAKRHFIDSAQALIRIEHPNIEALLDFGATDDGAPYHVMGEVGVDLATLAATEGRMTWARVRGIVLDVIAGVAALHRHRIVHGDISPHTIALMGTTARLVEFGAAELCEDDPTVEQRDVDVRGIAALAFALLTGLDPIGRTAVTLDAALDQTKAPPRVRAVLLRVLTQPHAIELGTLRRQLAGESRYGGMRARLSYVADGAAAVAAAAMLSIGLWSGIASSESPLDPSVLAGLVCDDSAGASVASIDGIEAPARSLAQPVEREPEAIVDEPPSFAVAIVDAQPSFTDGRARVAVGSEARRKSVTVHSRRINLDRELSPELLVERGIDLTHGRPTPDDDPRLPIVDGPVRARALFEAACARDYGKGCHMLGVQIAEGMVADDGAGPAEHYRRGCDLHYHRSCAALADLARAGDIDADADLLEAKACLLAGAGSSFCRPHT